MFRSKSQNVKTGLKLNVLSTIFVQFLAKNRIVPNYLPFNLIVFEIKMHSRSIPRYEILLVSFDLLLVAIRSFSNN